MEERYRVAFEIISIAGDSKSAAMLAAEAAKKGDFALAQKQIEQAEKDMVEAHEAQTGMLRQEIEGERVDVNILVVHAQDHLTMATMAIDNAKQFIALYRMIYSLEGELKELRDRKDNPVRSA